jgi:hypothetical protein
VTGPALERMGRLVTSRLCPLLYPLPAILYLHGRNVSTQLDYARPESSSSFCHSCCSPVTLMVQTSTNRPTSTRTHAHAQAHTHIHTHKLIHTHLGQKGHCIAACHRSTVLLHVCAYVCIYVYMIYVCAYRCVRACVQMCVFATQHFKFIAIHLQ